MASPLEQFMIKPIVSVQVGSVDVSFTNSSLFMTIAVGFAVVFFLVSVQKAQLVPGRLQSVAEVIYQFVADMIRTNVGEGGQKYFPFVFCLFVFVLLGNLIGLIPFTFTYTSHLAVTLGLALTVFVVTTIIGFAKHGLHFLHFFLPHGTPVFVAPILVPIEVLSYFTRPVSLSLRLFANMTAGHTLLKVFASFVFPLMAGMFVVGGLVPLVVTVALTGLELLVAFLQAYVFAVLTCIYLNDALHMH